MVTSGGQAELGRALGGYVNVVTKSGTNTLHGDLYGYFRNERFNAANALSDTTLPMTQTQYGASLGGPSSATARSTSRTSSSAMLEPDRPDHHLARRTSPRSTPGWPRSATRARRSRPASIPNPVHNTNFLAKVDHQFSRNDQFSVRYSLYDVHSNNSRGAGALERAQRLGRPGQHRPDRRGQQHRRRSRRGRSTKPAAQFTHSNLKAPPTDPIGPAVSISGVASFGTLSGSPTGRLNKLYEIVDNLSHQAGAHALRAGVDFLYNDDTITYPAVDSRQLLVLVARELPDRHLQQRRASRRPSATRWCRRPIPTSASTRRTSGRSARA